MAIDSEIKRLNWSRDDEMRFLEKNLSYKNRNEITNYKELVKYLNDRNIPCGIYYPVPLHLQKAYKNLN